MTDRRSLRGRMFSLRALIAVGGVAAATVGLAQAGGTLANPMQSVKTSSDVSVGNLYPTPLTAEVGCWTSGSLTSARGNIWWPEVEGATGYKVELVNRSNDTVRETRYFTPEERPEDWRGISDSSRTGLYARVYTINGPVTSTGYTSGGGMSFKDWVSGRTQCEGDGGTSKPNHPAEDKREWTPADGVPTGLVGRAAANLFAAPMTEAIEGGAGDAEIDTPETTVPESTAPETTAPDADSSGTTTPESSAPETSAPAETPGAGTPAPTTPPTSTTTEQPAPELTDPVHSGGLTAGWLPGGNKVALLDADGEELTSGRAGKGSALHWHNGQLWIVGETEVYRIMQSPQDGTWKYYRDSGQNMPSFD